MTERIPRSVFVTATLLGLSALLYAAYSRPWYFTSQTYLSGLIFLELLLASLWFYRRVFFALVLISFLFAGINLPVGGGWTAARWAVLAVGAMVGILLVVKDRGHHFGLFHIIALFVVLTGLISAAVSQHPDVALLKVFSMLLLFAYAATGARVAVSGRETNFFNGLLIGCEIFVTVNAAFYAIGVEVMGNPNSLGAVMGVVGAPILLWGVLLGGQPSVYRRRLLLYVICVYLAFVSHARAGIGAGLLSSAILCFAARRYKLLIQGATVLVIVLAATALFRPSAISSLTSSVVYKNNSDGILTSRLSPWQTTINDISEHPWFGMGFGTAANSNDSDAPQGAFASAGSVTGEHGSSYLAILAGVGILGAIPVAILLIVVVRNVVSTILAMRGVETVAHPAIVLAMLMIAELVHAAFEDWMFAPGNYLCVFFWCLAFVFHDFASPLAKPALHWHRKRTLGASPSHP